MTANQPPSNRAVVIGRLDRQTHQRGDQASAIRRNACYGHVDQITLQVASPFGQSYALPLQIPHCIHGNELLEHVSAGAWLKLSGYLIWEQQRDHRLGSDPASARQSRDLSFCVEQVETATAGEESGCDVQLEGTVLVAPRIVRHPDRPSMLLAASTLQVHVAQTRTRTRSHMLTIERIPLVVPLQHPDAPNLLRPGNRVRVDGMLERVLVALYGPDVEAALADLDLTWERQRSSIANDTERSQAERHYQRQRRRMGQALRSRVVAGYVELLDGTPASPREAQALRRASQKQKRSRSTNTTPRQSAPLCNLSLPVTERPLGPPPSGLPGQPSA